MQFIGRDGGSYHQSDLGEYLLPLHQSFADAENRSRIPPWSIVYYSRDMHEILKFAL